MGGASLRAVSSERLAQLRAMLAEDPRDAFLRYAVALELKRLGDMEQAIRDLEALLVDDPKHIPSYYQLALLLADTGRLADAVRTCEIGSLECIVTGDRKARVELIALMNALQEEE